VARLSFLGRAAARPESLTIISDDEQSEFELAPGSAVLVAAATLEPVARIGQWVLLGAEGDDVDDGDLAAVTIESDRRLLRRVNSEGEDWVLSSVNPVQPIRAVTVPKVDCAIRRIVGVLYEPRRATSLRTASNINEWIPRQDFDLRFILGLRCVAVEGESLNPIAWPGQLVLVGERRSVGDNAIRRGSLAVIDTDDDSIGCVIKRIYPREREWILVSSNPTDPHDPIDIAPSRIRGIWPLHGVLFEARESQAS
jgi:SOS-response transcriptional repressor LexA